MYLVSDYNTRGNDTAMIKGGLTAAPGIGYKKYKTNEP
jgi:hypothetical protein